MGELILTTSSIRSLDVAEMIGKRHSDLMRDISKYVSILENAKLRSQDFFITSTYKTEGNNKTYDCFQLTKKGCEMVANKMTGEKGILFTAAYIERFHELEQQVGPKLPGTYKEALLALVEAEEEKEQLQLVTAQKEQIIHELKPRADYTDRILNNKGLVTITQIAKDYGMSGKQFNKILHELGIQFKQSGQWLLYTKYHGLGYTHSKTIDITRSDGRPDVTMNTKWTQKGRLFIYELLKQKSILPTIEQK